MADLFVFSNHLPTPAATPAEQTDAQRQQGRTGNRPDDGESLVADVDTQYFWEP